MKRLEYEVQTPKHVIEAARAWCEREWGPRAGCSNILPKVAVMTVRLKINIHHFVDACYRHEHGRDWLSVPLFRWLHDNIGPMNLNKKEGEELHGEGWIFGSNIDQAFKNKEFDFDRDVCYYVDIDEPVDERLITEFLLRWS